MTSDEAAARAANTGPRLRSLRERRGLLLTEVSRLSGIDLSTLSRIENGRRRPSLEALLRLASAYGTSLDDLVGAVPPAAVRPAAVPPAAVRPAAVPPAAVRPAAASAPPRRGPDKTVLPLTRYVGGLHAHKHVLPATGEPPVRPRQGSHEGHEWVCVLYGRLWLALGRDDLVLSAGETVEFDTRAPHGVANAAPGEPVEYLVLFGPQGERLRPHPGGLSPAPGS
ncbi:helix-turn-helix domain-containing protein [Kitasatospora purpeofusca]|uniref:helix-turn-helix domain-containing protein n=1 Tax=Kitasatospora purpeofusca TaxID=67352 RepID=UPI0035E30211